jgi:hypothetical protein
MNREGWVLEPMGNRFDGAQESRDAGRSSNDLVWFLGQILRLPLAAFSYSVEMFSKTMQGITRMADQGIGTMTNDVSQPSAERTGCERQPGSETTISANKGAIPDGAATTDKETGKMDQNYDGRDQDLSGDDLKYVRYSIIFTKADLEATLQQDKDDLLTYATDGASYGWIKLNEFFSRVQKTPMDPKPEVWIRNDYPTPGHKWDGFLPERDKRYVEFVYGVERRVPKNTADYDKEQSDSLKEIARNTAVIAAKK